MGEECPWCTGYGTQFWEQVVFYKGHSRREMGSQKSACACQASYQEGKTTTQECCPKHSSGKWRACARVQGEMEQDQEILHRAGQGVGLRTLAAPWTNLMLNSFILCCNFCACKCACTVVVRSPRGGVGDRHLVTVPQGVVGDRLSWGGERQGAGGGRGPAWRRPRRTPPPRLQRCHAARRDHAASPPKRCMSVCT